MYITVNHFQVSSDSNGDGESENEIAGDPCLEEKYVGMCRAAIRRFYFDKESKECKKFIYGGTAGNQILETRMPDNLVSGIRMDIQFKYWTQGSCLWVVCAIMFQFFEQWSQNLRTESSFSYLQASHGIQKPII